MNEFVLKTENLTKTYHTLKAVDNVSMHVKRGDIYGFVGKNGAGKTTIIRLITGLIQKSGGSYELFGVKDTDKGISDVRRRILAVVETPSIYLNMNAYDNILMQMKVLGIVDEEQVTNILKLVGLKTSKKDHKIAKNYSLGMRQRLGIAIALVGSPDFLILDEPTNGLDPSGIIEMRELLLRLNREKGITIMISSHILSELAKLATTYGFIDQGQLIQEISASELERLCQKKIHVTVNNTKLVPTVLETLKISNYQIVNDTELNIFDEIDVTLIVNAFSKENIIVKKISEQNEDLESYFINLVGGRK